ncbi:MAG: PucR family transcriptional regulator ligand-binding domain-containing protein, partial [Sciscionella sp.]
MPPATPDVLALPTVSDVLALPELRAGKPRVVAGAASLGRPVRWVHVAEITDIAHLLAGGELLLTTGIALPDDADELAAYVDTLAEAGVAGVIIELVQRWHALPAALTTAAEHRDLPVITLARETRYVAVTEAVITRIRDAQLAELRAAEHIHEAFTAMTVAGAEPAEVLHEVTTMVELPVVLETPSHHVLAYEAAGTDPAKLLTDWRQRSSTVSVAGRTGYDPTNGWLVTIVGARGDDWGRLVMLTPEPPAHRHIVVAERAASALALNHLVAKEHDSLERQAHTSL